MLPQDAFLRMLPAIADDEQALRCEALLFAADSVAVCYETLRAITARRVADPAQITAIERVRIFNAAWSTVDQLHAALLLLRSMGFDREFDEARRFAERFKAVPRLRNAMDHLSERMGNHAASKRRKPPIFGSLSYLAVLPSDVVMGPEGPAIQAATSVVVMSGRVAGRIRVPGINPEGKLITPPTSCFRLAAFTEELDIEGAAIEFAALMHFLNIEIEKRVRSQAQALAEKHRRPLDELLAHPGSGFTLCLRFAVAADGPDGGEAPSD